ncbi:MAG: hypothetical protein N2645_08435 [Clostridia bacterium]|nr:hypothetical protein [Clostridia bacterium]
MSIIWSPELNISLRIILLSLVGGNKLNLESIAKELNIELHGSKDKDFLKRKMRYLANTDNDLKFLGYFKGKYLIAETETLRKEIAIRFLNTSTTYKIKATTWFEGAENAKNYDKYEQLSLLEEGIK